MRTNKMRILTTVCCVLAIVALYGCGGSSQLTEDAQLQNFLDSAVVRIRGAGNEPNVVSSSMAKDNNFFSSDTFAGDGVITGESLNESIDVDCAFAVPYLVDSGGERIATDLGGLNGEYTGALISMVDDVADCDATPALGLQSFGDIRNCCVYTLVADGAPGEVDDDDSCSVDIVCVVDETVAGLNVTLIQLDFELEQYMTTTMRDDSGAVATAIEERSLYHEGEPEEVPANQDIMTMDSENFQIIRSACTDVAGSFELLADDLDWVDSSIGASDFGDEDKQWQVDSIGAVNYDPGDVSECTLVFTGMYGLVDLSPLASSLSVEEYIDIRGAGMICNSQSETDCTPDALHVFE